MMDVRDACPYKLLLSTLECFKDELQGALKPFAS